MISVMFKRTFELLSEELELLHRQIVKQSAEVRHAIESGGGTHDNAMYDDAMHKRGQLMSRQKRLVELLDNVQFIEDINWRTDGNIARIGDTVQLYDCNADATLSYTLAGPADVDISIDRSKISVTSPLGKNVVGRKIGECFEFWAPSGKKEFVLEDMKRRSR